MYMLDQLQLEVVLRIKKNMGGAAQGEFGGLLQVGQGRG